MGAQRLLSPLELAVQVIGPLSGERCPELRLLASIGQVTQAGGDLDDLLLERGELQVRGRVRLAQDTLAAQRLDLALLGLLQKAADPNQLLPELSFLLALSLDRVRSGSQRVAGPRLEQLATRLIAGRQCGGAAHEAAAVARHPPVQPAL